LRIRYKHHTSNRRCKFPCRGRSVSEHALSTISTGGTVNGGTGEASKLQTPSIACLRLKKSNPWSRVEHQQQAVAHARTRRFTSRHEEAACRVSRPTNESRPTTGPAKKPP
ncbi:unnamed protein product, partial [Ectocarpus sp. 12 AP-2014]